MYRRLAIVPLVGGLLTGLGGIAILLVVFEGVDEIERMKAFGLAVAVGMIFWIASIWVMTGGAQPAA